MFYCSGNELKILSTIGKLSGSEKADTASFGVEHLMALCLMAMLKSKKPIVGLVRGQAIGIGFTTCGLFDFLYCTPEAKFSTPFMRSCQSPEGASTYTFV